jgi:hypothetical protein
MNMAESVCCAAGWIDADRAASRRVVRRAEVIVSAVNPTLLVEAAPYAMRPDDA